MGVVARRGVAVAAAAVSLCVACTVGYLAATGHPALYTRPFLAAATRHLTAVALDASTLSTAWLAAAGAQLACYGYCLSSLCRRHAGRPLVAHAASPPAEAYWLYAAGCLALAAWTFALDRGLAVWALAALAVAAVCLSVACVMCIRRFNGNWHTLPKSDVVAQILFVHNGLLLLQTWVVVSTVLSGSVVLYHRFSLDMHSTSLITMATLGAYWLAVTVADQIVLPEHVTRHVYAPYPVLVTAAAGVLLLRRRGEEAGADIAAITAGLLLGFSLLTLLTKVIMSTYNTCTKPFYPSGSKTLATGGQESSTDCPVKHTIDIRKKKFVASITLA